MQTKRQRSSSCSQSPLETWWTWKGTEILLKSPRMDSQPLPSTETFSTAAATSSQTTSSTAGRTIQHPTTWIVLIFRILADRYRLWYQSVPSIIRTLLVHPWMSWSHWTVQVWQQGRCLWRGVVQDLQLLLGRALKTWNSQTWHWNQTHRADSGEVQVSLEWNICHCSFQSLPARCSLGSWILASILFPCW